MTFKIQIFCQGKKQKRKLYESKEAYEMWWGKHKDFWQNIPRSGMIGYIDKQIDKTFGELP